MFYNHKIKFWIQLCSNLVSMGTYNRLYVIYIHVLHCNYVGVTVSTPDGEKTCKVMMLQSSLDLPARAIVSSMKQFNGKSSCTVCTQEGTPNPSCHLVRWWPYNSGVQLRTHQLQLHNAEQSARLEEPVREMLVVTYTVLLIYIFSCRYKGLLVTPSLPCTDPLTLSRGMS